VSFGKASTLEILLEQIEVPPHPLNRIGAVRRDHRTQHLTDQADP
jgi:hypothetical protein